MSEFITDPDVAYQGRDWTFNDAWSTYPWASLGVGVGAGSGGGSYISTNADAAALWRKRQQDIEELALARRQPRVMSRSR